MIKLSGQELKSFHQALLGAFDTDDFALMLAFEIEKEYEHLAPSTAAFPGAVLVIIQRAQREGWLRDLVTGAHNSVPGNAVLKEFHDRFMTLPAAKTPEEHYQVYYMYDREPLFGRPHLRSSLKTLAEPNSGVRIFVVDGNPVSGKSYTLNYISYLKDHVGGFQYAWIDLRQMTKELGSSLQPQDLGISIATQLGLNVPPERETEQASRWTRFFCDWLTGAIGKKEEISWIIIDECRDFLRVEIRDFVLALANRIALQLDSVRLVLLHYEKSNLPDKVLSRVEEERIHSIGETELIEFFRSIHCRCLRDADEEILEDRIVDSVTKVLRRVKADDERRLQLLNLAAGEEAASILNSPTAP